MSDRKSSAAFRKKENKAIAKLLKKGRILPVSRPVSASVKTYVKRAIGRELEHKQAVKEVFNLSSVVGYGLDNTASRGLTSSSLLPAIVQNAGETDRIGDILKPKKLQLRLTLRAMDVTHLGTNDNPFMPFFVRVVIYTKKNNIHDSTNMFLMDNGSQNTSLGTTPESWLIPYNKDAYIIHYSKQFKMCAARRATNGAAPNQYAQDAITLGHVATIIKTINIKTPKTFYYDAQSESGTLAGLPSNFDCYMGIAVCNANGTFVSGTDARLQANLDSILTYTDA